MNFFLGQVTPRRQTESDVYEPTVLLHRWAQKGDIACGPK